MVQGKKEESIIDFIVVCNKVLPHVEGMVIDEEKHDALTNFQSKTAGRVAKTTDHNSMFVNLKFKVQPEKLKRKEVFNYKDKKALFEFKLRRPKLTSHQSVSTLMKQLIFHRKNIQ